MRYRPLPKHEVALLCGVAPNTLTTWVTRGHLNLAPKSHNWHSPFTIRPGNELIWSAAAVKEAVDYAALSGQKQRRPETIIKQDSEGVGR